MAYLRTVNAVKTEDAGASGAISVSMLVPDNGIYRLDAVTVNLSAAPTTSENLTITKNAGAGSEYDTLLYSLDMSAGSTTDVLWQPDWHLELFAGDSVDVAYTNTDAGAYGVQITAVVV